MPEPVRLTDPFQRRVVDLAEQQLEQTTRAANYLATMLAITVVGIGLAVIAIVIAR